jgi:gamma-glutamylcyclotransferase (GGCT)/AIG2-like uncharacterized protein YtfP
LYDLGEYPGLSLTLGTDSVQGEVYAIDGALLPVLDAIEGITNSAADEYCRKSLEVRAGTANHLCWVYEVNPVCLSGKALIASGNWIAYRKAALSAAPHNDQSPSVDSA